MPTSGQDRQAVQAIADGDTPTLTADTTALTTADTDAAAVIGLCRGRCRGLGVGSEVGGSRPVTADGGPPGSGLVWGGFSWDPVPDDGRWRYLAGFHSGDVVRELVWHDGDEGLWGVRRVGEAGVAVIVVRGPREVIGPIWHTLRRTTLPRRWRDTDDRSSDDPSPGGGSAGSGSAGGGPTVGDLTAGGGSAGGSAVGGGCAEGGSVTGVAGVVGGVPGGSAGHGG